MTFNEVYERWKKRVPGYIDNGVAFMDSIAFKWWDTISYPIDMTNEHKCVFAQVTGMEFAVAIREYRIDEGQEVLMGFNLPIEYFYPNPMFIERENRQLMFNYLSDMWGKRVSELQGERSHAGTYRQPVRRG